MAWFLALRDDQFNGHVPMLILIRYSVLMYDLFWPWMNLSCLVATRIPLVYWQIRVKHSRRTTLGLTFDDPTFIFVICWYKLNDSANRMMMQITSPNEWNILEWDDKLQTNKWKTFAWDKNDVLHFKCSHSKLFINLLIINMSM